MRRYFIFLLMFAMGTTWISLSCSGNNNNTPSAPVTVLATATFTPTLPPGTPTPSPTSTPTLTPTSTPDFTLSLTFPATVYDLAADSSGNVYVLDNSGTAVTVYNNTGSAVTQWGSFVLPNFIDLDGLGNAYVLDRVNASPLTYMVKTYTTAGVPGTSWQVPVTSSLWQDLAVDGTGNVYFNAGGDNRIYKYNSAGVSLTSWTESTIAIAVNSNGTTLYGFDGTQIKVCTTAGAPVTTFTLPTSSVDENGIAVDSAGNLEINTSDCYITKFSPTGALLGKVTNANFCSGGSPLPITLDSSNNLYVGVVTSTGDHIDVFQPH